MSYFKQTGDEDDINIDNEVEDESDESDNDSDNDIDNESIINDEPNKDNDDDNNDDNIDIEDSDTDNDINEDNIEDSDNDNNNDDDLGRGDDDDDNDDTEIINDNETDNEKTKRTKKIPTKTVYKKLDIGEDDSDDDDDGELYLQKFDKSINNNYILNQHPESIIQNYDEILSMTKVVRDNNGIIIDDFHKTIPYLTKYEKARILGQRAKQINAGSSPFVKVPENVIDGYIIAELELKEKRIPFIIRRPLPNGGSEYWKIKDLEDISF
jgi:DNA-directed RNA polymerase subunit K/omega